MVVGAGGGGGGGSSSTSYSSTNSNSPSNSVSSLPKSLQKPTSSQVNVVIPIGIQKIFNMDTLSNSLNTTSFSSASSLPQEVSTLITQPAKKL